jgi:hypothetical protein
MEELSEKVDSIELFLNICMNIFSYVHLPLFVYMRSPPTKYNMDPGPYLGPTYDYP